MTPSDVRDRLVEALRLDLIGPGPEDAAYQAEVLDTAPSQPSPVRQGQPLPARGSAGAQAASRRVP